MSIVPENESCRNATERMDGYLSQELEGEARRAVEQHVASCPQCSAELKLRRRIKESVRGAVRGMETPPGLEGRVRQSVRREKLHPRTGLWAVAAAAAVILSVGLFQLWRSRSNPEETILGKTSGRLAAVMNVGLRDHLHCAVFRKYSKAPGNARQLAADLGAQYAGLIPLIQAKLPGDLRIVEAHLCSAGGRQYTHVIVAGGGKTLSLILTRRKAGESLSGGIHQTGVDRFQVVGFESHGELAYVISDLDAQQSLQLAANLAPALREFLTGSTG